jgi:Tfp pilus assembly PilM family ATPase
MFVRKKRVTVMALEANAVVVLQAKRSGSKLRLKRCAGVDIPLLLPEQTPRFMVDMKEFKGSAADAIEASGIKARKISLSIPDIVAKTAILDFEELPGKRGEADRVIKWKVARALYLSPEDLCIDYRVLSKEPVIRVFAVAVKKDVISGYEDTLIELGLSTSRINIHSLNLLNLLTGQLSEVNNFSLILLMDGYFSVSIFRDGVLDFYRCKSVHGDREHLVGELGSSFAFYRGSHHDVEIERTYLFNGDKGFVDVIKDVSGTEVVEVRPEDLLTSTKVVGEAGTINTATLLAALGAAAAN